MGAVTHTLVYLYELHLLQAKKLSPEMINTFGFRRAVSLPDHAGN